MISNPASEYSIISLIQTKQEYTLFAYNMSTEDRGEGGRRSFFRAHPPWHYTRQLRQHKKVAFNYFISIYDRNFSYSIILSSSHMMA